jgi:hypothetical protein
METKLKIETFLNDVVKQKEDIIVELISALKSTDDLCERNQIALFLAEHFKDDRIENCLADLIQTPKLKMQNGTLLFALGEYTNNAKYLYFLVDLILKNEKDNDGEIFMGAYSMIINLHPPLNKKEIARSIQRVKREAKKENITPEQKELITSLLNYLEGHKEIAKFYNQFS